MSSQVQVCKIVPLSTFFTSTSSFLFYQLKSVSKSHQRLGNSPLLLYLVYCYHRLPLSPLIDRAFPSFSFNSIDESKLFKIDSSSSFIIDRRFSLFVESRICNCFTTFSNRNISSKKATCAFVRLNCIKKERFLNVRVSFLTIEEVLISIAPKSCRDTFFIHEDSFCEVKIGVCCLLYATLVNLRPSSSGCCYVIYT